LPYPAVNPARVFTLDTRSRFPPRPVSDPKFFEPGTRPVAGAVHEEDAGYVVSPGVATSNLRRAGEREGVRFLLKRRVRSIEVVGTPRFRIDSDRGPIECDAVVNAAGPHSGLVNRMAGVSLPQETRPLLREVQALANPLSGQAGGGAPPVVISTAASASIPRFSPAAAASCRRPGPSSGRPSRRL
jgi:sarcosine oxidase subunit beta